MRLPLFRQKQNEDTIISSALDNLIQELAKIRQEEIKRLSNASNAQQFMATSESIATLIDIGNEVTLRQKQAAKLRPEEAVSLLVDMNEKVEQIIMAHARDFQSTIARQILLHTMVELCSAESRIAQILESQKDSDQQEEVPDSSVPPSTDLETDKPPQEENDAEESSTIESMRISSALLYHAHRSLFPPERMLVVAGHREANTIYLDATWDVTGAGPDTHAAHVRADAGKLGRALIDMDLSGTELGAWIHSHPGRGAAATTPSSIDRQQHQDWIQDYSPTLLSIIMVGNGYIRFWGSAVESGQLKVSIDGEGIIQEESNVYRLVQG